MTFKLDNRRPFPRCPENASGPGPAWPLLSECYDRTLSHHTASVRHSKKTLRGVLKNIWQIWTQNIYKFITYFLRQPVAPVGEKINHTIARCHKSDISYFRRKGKLCICVRFMNQFLVLKHKKCVAVSSGITISACYINNEQMVEQYLQFWSCSTECVYVH